MNIKTQKAHLPLQIGIVFSLKLAIKTILRQLLFNEYKIVFSKDPYPHMKFNFISIQNIHIEK